MMSYKKFVVYATNGEKKEFPLTGGHPHKTKVEAWNYYDTLLRNHRTDGVEVVIGIEEWYRVSDNRSML